MKQIVVMGDLSRWRLESDFIIEMLHLTASRVVTVNIGPRTVSADLNTKDFRRLFPRKTRDESVGATMAKLYTQGVVDGILCLLGNEPNLYEAVNNAFAALPFGMPKFALLSGDSTWQGGREVTRIHLPGKEYNLNPVIKICLSNTVFALSGMALCNIHNFGSSTPTVGTYSCEGAERSLTELGVNFISSISDDNYLRSLIRNGYIHGLLLGRGCEDLKGWLEVAGFREIPVVIVCKDPIATQAALESITPSPSTPVVLVSPKGPVSHFRGAAAAAKSPQDWLRHQSVPFKYGTESFYLQAAKTMLDLLG